MDIFLIVILGVLTMTISFFSTDGLSSPSYHWWNRPTKKFWRLAAMNLIIIGIAIYQYISSEKEKKVLSDQRDSLQKSLNDSLRVKIDSGVFRITNGMAQSFKEQNLEIDHLNGKVTNLKIPPSTTVPEPKPIVFVESINHSMQHDTTWLIVDFKSTPASATINRLRTFMEITYTDGTTEAEPDIVDVLDSPFELPADKTTQLNIPIRPHKQIKSLFILWMIHYVWGRSNISEYRSKLLFYDYPISQLKFTSPYNERAFLKKYAKFKLTTN